jgi:CubicO group peptidase (beta-lactamase class C family)
LEQAGIDSQMIAMAIGCIYANKYDQIHSMLIYKDSILVFEKYFEGNKYKWDGPDYYGERIQWDKDSMHVIMSCTKSFTSACIGIAIDKGFIKSVNESIFNYLPDYQSYKTDGKENISIEHLLTMTSGLKWNEWGAHDPSTNDIDGLYSYCQSDPVSCVLEKPLVYKPGEKFTYNGGGMIILGEILKNATSMNIEEFSKMYIFEPLGIESAQWYQFENGTYACDGSLIMTPRDMLKFGVIYLNEGNWNNKRILSKEWVEKSKKTYNNNTGINIPLDDSGKNGYAYSWWTNEISVSGEKFKLFQAGGWGGQEIIVFPDKNMVIVFTGGNYTVKKHLYKVLKRYILPSLQ